MSNYIERMSALREQIEKLEDELYTLKVFNSSYFIGVTTIGNVDCWEEFYHLLGHITHKEAEDWLEENGGKSNNTEVERVYPVSEEEYRKYRRVQVFDSCVSKMHEALYWIPDEDGRTKLGEAAANLEQLLETTLKEIGLWSKYKHIV